MLLVGPGQPARLLLKEGACRKAHARGKKNVASTLVLLSDQLIYATPLSANKLEFHRKVELADAATAFEDAGDVAVGVLSSTKSSTFSFETPAIKAQWLAALAKAQTEARRRHGKDDDDGVAMSIWQQDSAACAISKVKFTALNRRHHCRVMGECVSADASRARFDLTCLNKGASRRFGASDRVCDWCCRDRALMGGDWAAVVRDAKNLRRDLANECADKWVAAAFERESGLAGRVVHGCWIWKKGTGARRRGQLFGRTNWKKRWCEVRESETGGFDLLYFDEPNDPDVRGRVDLAGSSIRVADASLLSLIIDSAGARDYPIRTLDHERADAVEDVDRGAFHVFLMVLEEAARRATAAVCGEGAGGVNERPPPPPPAEDSPALDLGGLAEAEWYWQHHDGSQMGPSTLAEMRQAFSDGDLIGTCHVFAEEVTGDWLMLDDCPRVKYSLAGRESTGSPAAPANFRL